MITLSSDFGVPYPAAMKGVILSRSDARLVDVSHAFPRQDVRATAFWLREVLPYFPSAVHLIVVDPGVGTDRAALVVRAGEHVLVGPDNGVLVPVARALAAREASDGTGPDAESLEVYRVLEDAGETDTAWPPDPDSSTFHGRDVFAPAAARVHEYGVDAADPGLEPTGSWVELAFPTPEVGTEGASGTVLVVDDFGNAITNVPGTVLEGLESVEVNGDPAPVRNTYATRDPGDRLVTVGSHGNVELAVNRGRGSEAFEVAQGDTIELRW